MPLCTILAKWPAPTVPACTKPSSRGPSGRSASNTGMTLATTSVVAADHEPVAVLETPDTARDTGVEEVDTRRGEHVGVLLVVLVVRVAAVDEDVARGQQAGELVDDAVGDRARTGTITQTTRSPAGSASTSASSEGTSVTSGFRSYPVTSMPAARMRGAHVRAHLAQTHQTDVHDCASLGSAIARPTVPHVARRVRRSAGEADGHQQVAVLRVVLAVERLLAGELHRLVRVRERQPDERRCSARRARPAGTAG